MTKVPYLSKWIKMFRKTPLDDIPTGGSDLPSTEGASVGDVLTVNGPDDVVWSTPFKPYTKVTGSFDNTGHITIQNNTYTDAGRLTTNNDIYIDMDASVDFPQAVLKVIVPGLLPATDIHVQVGTQELIQVYSMLPERVEHGSNAYLWGFSNSTVIISILGDTFTVHGDTIN